MLGTPEFMAPDMYEDKPYDEKVDIYAFGMCVLEIFTQEIPYSECTNPAQIYKKVSSGEPPEILGRIQSKHARDFVNYCLGYRDSEGNYIRPTVSELLQHPFLAVRENDDDEVIVDPPLRETMIAEAIETSGSQSMTSIPLAVEGNNAHDDETAKADLPPRIPRSAPELEDDDGDEFQEMPESETNMKRITVLMGRDTEWKEDEQAHAATVTPIIREGAGAVVDTTTDPVPSASRGFDDSSRHVAPHPSAIAVPNFVDPKPFDSRQEPSYYNYVVATVVIEDEGQNVRPYADEILKLVVTLPIEGQTQNVQFDFDLVGDDPIQVAKEMVEELGIPQGAVLEISETISGLARAARMKQDRYAVRMRSAQNSVPGHPLQQGLQPLAPQLQQQIAPPVPVNSNAHLQHQQGTTYQQHLPVNVQQQQPAQFHQIPSVHDPSAQNPMLQNAPLQNSTPVFDYSQLNVSSVQIPRPHLSGHFDLNLSMNGQHVPSQVYLTPQKAFGSSQSVPGEHQQMQVPQHHSFSSFPVSSSQQAMPQSVGPIPPQHIHFVQAHHSMQSDHIPQMPIGHSNQAPIPAQVHISVGQLGQTSQPSQYIVQQIPPSQPDPQSQPPTPMRTVSSEQVHTKEPVAHTGFNGISHSNQNGVGLSASGDTIRADEKSSPPVSRSISEDALKTGDGTLETLQHDQVEIQTTSPSFSDSDRNVANDFDSDDEDSDDEVRKLDQDFQKNLQRARKVYDSRMDSLQRCKVEREEQHLKTLEKHEKERAEFEKRLAQEAEQQRKRIEQLQLEWDRQRELARAKKKLERTNSDNSASNTNPEATHSRSVSNASTIKSTEGSNGLATLSGEAGDTERQHDPSLVPE